MEKLMLTSGYNFEGYKITDYIGFYSGECALGTGFLSTFEAGIADFLGSSSSKYEGKLSKAKAMAISELTALAESHGANAIIGVDVDYTIFSADIMGVVANGTAVRIEAIQCSNPMLPNSEDHTTIGEKHINFPIINYYENLTIRPFNSSFDTSTNKMKISIYHYTEEKLNAMNVDVIANTIFGTFYEYTDINFVDFKPKGGIIETEEIFLNIDYNQIKVIQSMTIKINHYILDGKVYSPDEPYQISTMPIEQLLQFRKSYGTDIVSDFQDDSSNWTCMCGYNNDTNINKCFMCERNKGEYTKAKNGKKVYLEDLMPTLVTLQNCQEISTYLKDIEQKEAFHFPDEVMDNVRKMTELERTYGNMKESLIDALKKYVSENE